MKESGIIKVKYKSGVSKDGEYLKYDYDYVNASTKHTKRFNTAE